MSFSVDKNYQGEKTRNHFFHLNIQRAHIVVYISVAVTTLKCFQNSLCRGTARVGEAGGPRRRGGTRKERIMAVPCVGWVAACC